MINIYIYKKHLVKHASACISWAISEWDTFIIGLKSNLSYSRPATLVAKLGSDGSCYGSVYSILTDHEQMLLATIKFMLQDYEAIVRLNNNRIIFQSEVTCELEPPTVWT